MSSEPKESFYYPEPEKKAEERVFVPPKKNSLNTKTILKHLGLFILTFISVSTVSTILVGLPSETAFWGFIPTSEEGFLRGILFATLLLAFLTFHEFGHYFAAVYHKVEVSLPYYIPIPVGIGTLGAVIRIKEQIHETKKLFDIGAAGPIAGFIVSIALLFVGFSTLPEVEYLNQFTDHSFVIDYYNENGEFPEQPKVEEG